MNASIDKKSKIPLYKQVVNLVKNAVRKGEKKNGDAMPSLNEFAGQYGISMETTKKAYNILKEEGLLSGYQGKGYFIDIRDNSAPLRILMLVDKLSPYKLAIHKGLSEALEHPAEITIYIHNQDIGIFDKMLRDTLNEYDYCLVAAHFPKGVRNAKVAKILKRIPNDKLILIDKDIPEIKGHIGRVYQDFANDAALALENGMDMIKKYRKVVIIVSVGSLYGSEICAGVRNLLRENGVKCRVGRTFEPEMMISDTLFIVLCGQLDTNHFTIIREATARGFTLGKDIGLISYNDEPVNEFISGGLSCLSSDFEQMGREAAAMINKGRMQSVHAPFKLIARASL